MDGSVLINMTFHFLIAVYLKLITDKPEHTMQKKPIYSINGIDLDLVYIHIFYTKKLLIYFKQ